MKRYVFDLDNTLVYTDKLNTEAYNFALMQIGRKPIENVQRITRNVVLSHYALDENEIHDLIALKQKFFAQNIKKVCINREMVSFLRKLDPEKCILWTRAEQSRTECILEEFELKNCFLNILYSSKTDIAKDIRAICEIFQCQQEDLRFYDDELGMVSCYFGCKNI